jgi:hypothetical protein
MPQPFVQLTPDPRRLRQPTSRLWISPFHAQGEVSPGKNARLHCTTAVSMVPLLDHEHVAVSRPLARLGNVSCPVRVPRFAARLHAPCPHSVTLMQWRFAPFAVVNSVVDFQPQECVRARRTKKDGRSCDRPSSNRSFSDYLPAIFTWAKACSACSVATSVCPSLPCSMAALRCVMASAMCGLACAC